MYVISYNATIAWAPDGAGPMTVPTAQALKVVGGVGQPQGVIVVPGGDAPTGGNLTTAATAVGTAIGTQLNANLALIQGWATGGD